MATSDATGGDANLVSRAVGGDQQAFADIYDRYADSIYSFCRSRLRSEADAADATQDTFVRAVTRLSQLRDPDKLRPWLYAIARNEIVSTARTVGRSVGDDAMVHLASSDPEPHVDLLRVESAAQLWAAAGGLKDRDHDVLELHLRHGLVGQELADALGVSESHANVMLSRMRDRIATSLGSLLVAQHGREECEELDAVLDGWDGQFTLAIRSRVTRHTKSCEICERTRGAALASSLSFGVLPMVAAPRFLRDLTVDSMASAFFTTATSMASSESGVGPEGGEAMKRGPSEQWSWREDGFPGEVVAGATRRGFWLLSAAAVAVLAALGATLYALSGPGSDDVVEASGGLLEVSSEPAATTQLATSSGSPATGAEATDLSASVLDASDSADPEAQPASTSVTHVTVPATGTPTTEGPSIAGQSGGAGAPTTAQTATTSTPATGGTSSESTAVSATTAVPATSTSEAPTTAATATTGTTAPTTTDATTATGATSTSVTSTTATTRTTAPTTTSGVPPATTTTSTAAPNAQPIIDSFVIRPNPVQVAQGRCAGQQASVFVEASDSDGRVVAVVIRWSPDGVEFRAESMDLVAGTYRVLIGPWTVDGPHEVDVVIADDGGAATSDRVKLTVTPCPVGRLTLTP